MGAIETTVMLKREAELKSAAMRAIRRHTSFLILEYATNGAPDREIIGNGITTRWEFKHGVPTSQGNQELMCMRLAAAGHCRYVIWIEPPQRTLIVHPQQVHDRSLTPEASCVGFDMQWLVAQVRKAHAA